MLSLALMLPSDIQKYRSIWEHFGRSTLRLAATHHNPSSSPLRCIGSNRTWNLLPWNYNTLNKRVRKLTWSQSPFQWPICKLIISSLAVGDQALRGRIKIRKLKVLRVWFRSKSLQITHSVGYSSTQLHKNLHLVWFCSNGGVGSIDARSKTLEVGHESQLVGFDIFALYILNELLNKCEIIHIRVTGR